MSGYKTQVAGMTRADKLVATNNFQAASDPRRQSIPFSEHRKALLTQTLKELSRMRLLNAVTPELSRTWIAGLANKTDEEIQQGLVNARDFTGFFSLPAFRELCEFKAGDFGIPDLQTAYRECCDYQHEITRKPFSHPGLYWVCRQTGSHELKSKTEQQVMPRFKGFYDEMVTRVSQGEVFEIPELQMIERNAPDKNYEPQSEGYREFKRMVAEAKARMAKA